MQGALDGAVFAQLGDVGILRGWGVVLRVNTTAKFFGCQHGIEIAPAGGGFLIQRLGFAAFALRGECAGEPVLPCGVVLQLGRHGLDDVGKLRPILLAQGGAGKPFKLLAVELVAVGVAVVIQCAIHVEIFGVHQAEYTPCEARLFAVQAA